MVPGVSSRWPLHHVSVVIPVHQGEETLPSLVSELTPLTQEFSTPDGHLARVTEVLLVHDCGPDRSDSCIRRLSEELPWVRPVWLSRNFGQHAATLAGISSSGGDWVVTLDEDGQHDPRDIGRMLDVALAAQADLVYASPTNEPPHGWARNTASRSAKRLARVLSSHGNPELFHSYRLILGDVARSVAAYAGSGVYLDVALSWVARRVTTADVEVRTEGRATSGYRTRSLLSHYWRLILTAGVRPLRIVSLSGFVVAVTGVLLSMYIVVGRIMGNIPIAGWASVVVILLVTSGITMLALGVVAEYVGIAVNMAMGRPLYLIVSDRHTGPLQGPSAVLGVAAPVEGAPPSLRTVP